MPGNARRRGFLAAAVLAVLLPGAAARGGILGVYTFTGVDPGGDNQTPNGNGTSAPNLAYGSFTRTGLTAVSQADVFRSTGYTSAAINTGQYASFTVTADPGYALQLTSLGYSYSRSGGGSGARGPRNGAVRSSFESYAAGSGTGSTFAPANSGATGTSTWDFTDYTSASAGTASFRFYGWDGGSGHLNLDNLTLNGEVVSLAKMQASVSTPTTPVIVGASSTVDATVSNTATGGTVQQGLNYSVSGSGDLSGSGGNTNLAPGAPEVVTLTIDTSTAGAQGGTVTVTGNNAYSTNGTAGQTTFNQAVNVNVLDHSNGSFDDELDADTVNVDFGTVTQGSTQSIGLALHNLEATAGFTAGLDLDDIAEVDTAGVFAVDLTTFTNLAAGANQQFLLSLDTSQTGTYSVLYTLTLSDQDLPGATGGQTLIINAIGNVEAIPEPMGLGLLLASGALLLRRRR